MIDSQGSPTTKQEPGLTGKILQVVMMQAQKGTARGENKERIETEVFF